MTVTRNNLNAVLATLQHRLIESGAQSQTVNPIEVKLHFGSKINGVAFQLEIHKGQMLNIGMTKAEAWNSIQQMNAVLAIVNGK